MPICKLCLEREATKTNSHIFPHSLIKETINLGGSKSRDKEFVFNFSNNSSPSHYQGQGIIPEALENLELPIDNIEKEKRNSTTEDNIFCPYCESRFSVIEGYFVEKIINPFYKSDIFQSEERTTFSLKSSDNRLLRLYVYGLFWRASISKLYDFKLSDDQEERLRVLIHGTMDLQIANAQLNTMRLTGFCDLPLAVFTMEKFDDTTRSFIDANVFSKKPYMNLIGDFVFFLYFDLRETKLISNDFYGLAKYLRLQEVVNWREDKMVFGKIFKAEREIITKNALNFVTTENINFICGRFSHAHKRFLKKKPRNEDLIKFRNAYIALGINVSDAMKIKLITNSLVSIAKTMGLM